VATVIRHVAGTTGAHRLALACVLASVMVSAVCASEPAVIFRDRTADLGLTLGGGEACWVDLDNDGWVDLCESGVV